jgi:hypothetical protein
MISDSESFIALCLIALIECGGASKNMEIRHRRAKNDAAFLYELVRNDSFQRQLIPDRGNHAAPHLMRQLLCLPESTD